jgi:hypothetical protein
LILLSRICSRRLSFVLRGTETYRPVITTIYLLVCVPRISPVRIFAVTIRDQYMWHFPSQHDNSMATSAGDELFSSLMMYDMSVRRCFHNGFSSSAGTYRVQTGHELPTPHWTHLIGHLVSADLQKKALLQIFIAPRKQRGKSPFLGRWVQGPTHMASSFAYPNERAIIIA